MNTSRLALGAAFALTLSDVPLSAQSKIVKVELTQFRRLASAQVPGAERVVGRGLSGDIYGKEGRVSTVGLGSLTLRDVSVLVTPAEVRSRQAAADAIIGNNALRRFNVIFDYAHLKIHLKPNRYFAEPFR